MTKVELLSVFHQFRRLVLAAADQNEWSGFESGLTASEWEELQVAINKEHQYNPWFTAQNVRSSLRGIATLLKEGELNTFANRYAFAAEPRTVAIIMAGNLPFVGFHDVLCVLLSGNKALCKLSSSDSRIPMYFLNYLKNMHPELTDRIQIAVGPIKGYQAVIATGSNNTIEQLKSYFGHVPSLFRKNRTSVAVLSGNETKEELEALSDDCFLYFGMGCRNVGKLYLPADFDTNRIFEAFLVKSDVINHHKYANNYDYQRTVHLMNSIPFLDNNCFILKEDNALHAPLSMIHFERYNDLTQVQQHLKQMEEEIQVVVGVGGVPFGSAQFPGVHDFADGVDTMAWLNQCFS